MPVHGPTAFQAKLKLEGRSVLTCGSLGRCRSVGAVMLTSLELGEMVTDRVRRAYGTMSTHIMATEPKSSPAGGLCEHSGFPQALHRKGWLFGRYVTVSIDSRVQLA